MAKNSKKLFYKIGEVCQICGIEPHVLRYWESEFKTLSPTRNRSGQRIYRQKDLELVQTIKDLLYAQGYTIAGARKRLQKNGSGDDLPLFRDGSSANRKVLLKEVDEDLQAILKILNGDRPSS